MISIPGASSTQLMLIAKTLNDQLPKKTIVSLFGSRVEGGFRPDSDLDVLIEYTKPLELHILARLKSELEESSLPFKVDLVEYSRAPEEIQSSLKSLKKIPLEI